jgi:hypothetical protein
MNVHEPQDERLAAWHGCMDGEETPPADAEDLPPEQQRQLADEQLLHALLRGRYSDSESSADQRVGRVLKAITPRPAKPLWFRLVRACALSSAAALVVVVLLIELLMPQTTSATPDFDRVVRAFMDDGDRAYSIQFTMQRTDDDSDVDRPIVESPRPPHPKHPRGPSRLDGATLYLRGAKQYVFEIKLPGGKTVWIGQDGQHAWAVRPHGPVLISEDHDAFYLPFFEEMTTIPLIDVRDTLKTARQGYRLDPPKRVTMDDGREAEYFLARREAGQSRHPQRIELWADPKTGLLYRMICSQIHFGGMLCRQLRMDYLNGTSLPGNWFKYSEHTPDGEDADVKPLTKREIQQFRRQHHQKRMERWKRRPHPRTWDRRRHPTDRFTPPPDGNE